MKAILFVVLIFTVSCQKDNYTGLLPVNRAVIVYMTADNDLSGDAPVDPEEMKRSYKETGVNLIVLMDVAKPYLLRITEGSSETIQF
jgi:hypothetical protein